MGMAVILLVNITELLTTSGSSHYKVLPNNIDRQVVFMVKVNLTVAFFACGDKYQQILHSHDVTLSFLRSISLASLFLVYLFLADPIF